jgi:hypothetical protein
MQGFGQKTVKKVLFFGLPGASAERIFVLGVAQAQNSNT